MYSILCLPFIQEVRLSTVRVIKPGSTLENIAPIPLFSLFNSFSSSGDGEGVHWVYHFALHTQDEVQVMLHTNHE